MLSILIRILDFAFPLALQLARLPLFTLRIIGDGAVAAIKGIVRCLPIAEKNREAWRELIGQKWSWLRQRISYQVFEQAVHRAFEHAMEWVFRKCRNLTPREALFVLTGAVLWLPVSIGAATAIHVVLLAKAASLPAWMQLLHPFATIVAKSKLMVLPVYPAAWPQAKKHPLVQAIARGYQSFRSFSFIQKMGVRYRQTEHAAEKFVAVIRRLARRAGVETLSKRLSTVLAGLASWGNAFRKATRETFDRLSDVSLIGPVVRSYAAHYRKVEHRNSEKLSEKLSGFFERWSIKFSAEYYEAKEREKAAKSSSEEMPGRTLRSIPQ